MKIFIYSKMIQKIVILATILSFVQEYKGVHCANNISYEFNLMCYVTMYSNINRIFSYMDQYPGQKYLKDPLNIWVNYNNITKWCENPIDAEIAKLVQEDVSLTLKGYKFNEVNWTTQTGKRFYEKLNTNIKQEIQQIVLTTFKYCQKIIDTLSIPTVHLEQPLYYQFIQNSEYRIPISSFYGCMLFLMKDDDYLRFIYNKQDDDQEIYLIYIIDDALQDMYIGMMSTLLEINVSVLPNAGTHTVDHELIKIMITVFCKVVKLTEEMFYTKDIRGVQNKFNEINRANAERNLMYSLYDYEVFKRDFHGIWMKKLSFGLQDYIIGPFPVSRGRLIRNGKFDPSIIGYYAIYEESLENLEPINYVNNMDHRIVFLMELNAWTTVLYENLQNLRKSQGQKGLQNNLSDKPNFAEDINFIKQFEQMF